MNYKIHAILKPEQGYIHSCYNPVIPHKTIIMKINWK